MKKSRKTAIAGKLKEMMLKGEVVINKDGHVFHKGVLKKRSLSKYILKKMGARLNPHSMLYEVKGDCHEKEAVSRHAQRVR